MWDASIEDHEIFLFLPSITITDPSTNSIDSNINSQSSWISIIIRPSTIGPRTHVANASLAADVTDTTNCLSTICSDDGGAVILHPQRCMCQLRHRHLNISTVAKSHILPLLIQSSVLVVVIACILPIPFRTFPIQE
jgi:hypothetical protein